MQFQVTLHTTYANNEILKSESHSWTASQPEALHAVFVSLHARLASLPANARAFANLTLYNDACERLATIDLTAIALAHPR
jgi:hypothetical protein